MFKNSKMLIAGMFLAGAGCSGETAGQTENGKAKAQPQAQATTPTKAQEGGPAIKGPNLGGLLNFTKAAECEWNNDAQELLSSAFTLDAHDRIRPATVKIPVVGESVKSRVTNPSKKAPSYVQVDLDFSGKWLNLQVMGLTHSFYDVDAPGDYSTEASNLTAGDGIRFAAPVSDVVAALKKAGFRVNRDGSTLAHDLTDASGEWNGAIETSVESRGAQTVFYCNYFYD